MTKRLRARNLGRILLFTAVCHAFAGGAFADTIQLITNGNFETGNFTGWTVVNQAGSFVPGNWFISTPGTATPVSAFPTLSTGGGPHGSFYAVTDQGGPGTHALLQTFSVTPGATSV